MNLPRTKVNKHEGYTYRARDSRERSEGETIPRAQRGDAVAFECLYEDSKRVYSVCLRMLKNTSDAEDLTQQIFLRLFRKIGRFRGDSCFSTWLHRVAVNAVLVHLRRKRPAEIHPDSPQNYDCEGNFKYTMRYFGTQHEARTLSTSYGQLRGK
jgi:DNA-directed RNA polymerase specialized sigma24 family protein